MRGCAARLRRVRCCFGSVTRLVAGVMARHIVAWRGFAQLWFFCCAQLGCGCTTGAESASRWRVGGRWWLALQDCTVSMNCWVRNRHRRHEGVGVMMAGAIAQRVWVGDLAYFSEIHHQYPRADGAHYREVVRNKDERQSIAHFHLLQDVEDLCLDADVER